MTQAFFGWNSISYDHNSRSVANIKCYVSSLYKLLSDNSEGA
jgi:hypothetical protein